MLDDGHTRLTLISAGLPRPISTRIGWLIIHFSPVGLQELAQKQAVATSRCLASVPKLTMRLHPWTKVPLETVRGDFWVIESRLGHVRHTSHASSKLPRVQLNRRHPCTLAAAWLLAGVKARLEFMEPRVKFCSKYFQVCGVWNNGFCYAS